MLFSTSFVALAVTAGFVCIGASPVDSRAAELEKRQEDYVTSCYIDLATKDDKDIYDVPLPQEIRAALSKAIVTNHPDAVVTPSTAYAITRNRNNSWNYLWYAPIADSTTGEAWTGAEVRAATRELAGQSIETDVTTWTIQVVNCLEPTFAKTSKVEAEDSFTNTVVKEEKRVATRQATRPTCTFKLRPDDLEELYGVELRVETFMAYVEGVLVTYKDVAAISSGPPHTIILHSDGSLTASRDVIVIGNTWNAERTKEGTEALAGVHIETYTAKIGWLLEDVSCTL